MRFATLVLIFSFLGACSAPYSQVPLAAPRSYSEGEEALASGEFDKAVQQLGDYLASGRPTYRPRAFYQLARAHYLMENYGAARSSLDDLEREFPGFGKKQAEALRGDIAYALGRPVDAIFFWESAFETSNADERDALLPRIAGAMTSLSRDQAKEVAAGLHVPQIYDIAINRVTGTTNPDALLASETDLAMVPGLAHEGVDTAAAPQARDTLTSNELLAMEASGSTGTIDVPAEATNSADQGVDGRAAVDTIDGAEIAAIDIAEPGLHIGPRVGALLPLTGSARESGRSALTVLRNTLDPATLLIRDTGSDPAIAEELLRQLAANPDVIAVLGPISPPVIAAVRRKAATLDLPVLPLQGEGVAANATNPPLTLATYAVRNLHASRIGILAPSPTAGIGFADAATSVGATVVSTHIYSAENLDLNSLLAAVQTWIDSGGVDAVYIADSSPRAIQVAKAARAVAPKLILLGDATWNDSEALAANATELEGAVIIAPPNATNNPGDSIARVAAALQRAVAMGETSRSQTRSLLQGFEIDPQAPGLMKVVGGKAVAVVQEQGLGGAE